ncbi:MAG TPA: EamA family transporter [Casimicrobiaceae bacterium]|jgi:drug/metabolite transporter (DMT)-like permease
MNRQAIVLALIAALAFGAGAPIAKALLGAADPWVLAGLLYLGAGVGLGAIRLARPNSGEAPLRRADVPRLSVVIVAGGVLGPLLLMSGLARTNAAAASLTLNVEAIATMAIAWLAYREPVDRRLLLGAAAIVAGAVVLAWTGPARLDVGTLLVAGACLCWGVDNNVSRQLAHADPVALAAVKGLAAGSVNLALGLATGATLPAVPAIASGLLLGLIAYGMSLVLYLRAMRELGAARTAAYFGLAPFAGAAIAVVAFGDPLTPRLAAAGALMAFGVWLHVTERHDHEHHHLALEHEHRHIHDEHHGHAHALEHPAGEPHSHRHRHEPMTHQHPHAPDIHHRHGHDRVI